MLSIPADATHRAEGGANEAAVVTLAGVANMRWELFGYKFSYSADPTGGEVTVEMPSGTEVDGDFVKSGGPGPVILPVSIYGGVGLGMVATLAAGGEGITSKLTVYARLIV